MPTQERLYSSVLLANLDPALSWAEHELPERERTKHVHRLHPYLGKFVPQLVEVFLNRYFTSGSWVLDPFAGSGTTLVECSTFGANSVGADISAFNALLCAVKTDRYNPFVVEHDLRHALSELEAYVSRVDREDISTTPAMLARSGTTSDFLQSWYDPRALAELIHYRGLIATYPESAALMRVVLSRAARSARLTTHFNLDFPKMPQNDPYQCYKHRRICTPTREAYKFLRRYTLDTIRRVKEYSRLRTGVTAEVLHGDSRSLDYGRKFDGLITSPPYPGRIDYHEQHRYAFELLDLDTRLEDEIGAAAKGLSRRAVTSYVDDMIAVFSNSAAHLRPGSRVVIVIDDARELYDEILERSGLEVDERLKRHVNRRTGRRAGEFFEQIIVAHT